MSDDSFKSLMQETGVEPIKRDAHPSKKSTLF